MMRKLAAILFALLTPLAAHAQGTAKSKSVLETEIQSCFLDNTTGQITPAVMRGCMQDFLSSWQQFANVNAQSGTSYTVANSDYGGLITSSNGSPVAITLGAATSAAGFYPFNFWVSDLGVGAVTITPSSGTINGASSFTLTTNQYAWIVADGTNWQVVPITASAITINGANANSLAYYATTGTTISGLTSCAAGVYITTANVPSCATTLPTMLTYPSPIFSGQMVMPDSSTWDSTGINSAVIGATTPENGTFATLAFTTLSSASLAGSPSTITGLTVNNSPNASNDYFLYYSASAGQIEKCTIGSCTSASAAGVTSLNGLTGGLSVTNGGGLASITPSGVSVAVAIPPGTPRGRLTLQSHTPVMTTAQVNKSTVYYDCYGGGYVPVYNGTIDLPLPIGSCEISDVVPTSSTGVANASDVFDLWAVNVSGTLTLCHATNGSGGGWSADTGGSITSRGSGYTQLDNTTRTYITNANSIADCYNGSSNKGSISANHGTYLGTFYTTGAGQTGMAFRPTAASGGTAPTLGLFNAYNQVPVIGWSQATNSTTYTTSTYREFGNSASNRVSWVDGLGLSLAIGQVNVSCSSAGASASENVGVNFNATSGTPNGYIGKGNVGSSGTTSNTLQLQGQDYLYGTGFNFAQAMESGGGTNGYSCTAPNTILQLPM